MKHPRPGKWPADRPRHQAALAALSGLLAAAAVAGCGSGGSRHSGPAAQYLAIAIPANHQLDKEVDGFGDHAKDDLAAAQSDLRAEAATEHHFDQQLAGIVFPDRLAALARQLILANQRRIELTDYEASSASLTELRAFGSLHAAADAAVEAYVRQLRRGLGLPPPPTG
jgi:hypothetical protein